ncbi:MAG: 50S ribosomal protein L30e [Thermoplasmata archaeon]|nr:MAG: 50S ribosomal protein L30e [Thermoplasmata archaeon]MCD6468231.1 50S ribosomal protein L30e [Thermoplasmata archaeon]RLF26629.1 MAG: 50S ribosomal protein L30e [Thermoplasmata archaeon]
MVDVGRVLKSVMRDGKVAVGIKEVRNALKEDKAKMVVAARNCPYAEEIRKAVNEKEIKYYEYPGTGVDLGYTCGKPFSISTFAVIDAGGSDILKLAEKG